MESNSEASCISDPNFAVICAFLERFAKPCGITHPPFLDLQEMLENIDEVPQQLIDLHVILLRKARRSVFREKWEKALVKFCQIYSTQDGWEIERFGYKNSRLEVKLRVLKNLLEGQFDLNCKFKSIINTHESSELRSKPVGKDKSGRIYWLQIDPISNIRVYREDLDEESWTLVAKDRDTLVQLLQELTVDEEPVDVNLLNEDSSVSADIEKTILDTGQENGISDVVTNGDALIEEKDPLEIKTGDTMINDVGYDDCYNEVLSDVGKRVSEDLFPEGEFKKAKLDDGENDMEVGEAIDDPVMHIYGEGNGAECDAGNPDKEEPKNNEGNSSNTSDQSEPGQTTSTDVKKLDLETKPQPKLWSIDTICGTGFNHSGESSKNVKNVQKNFSSFSIESVLEKKSDSNHSSSPVPESPIISVNAITENDPALGNINQTNEQIASTSDFTVERNESQLYIERTEDITASEEGKSDETEGEGEKDKPANCENETDPVPVVEHRTNDENSTICAENSTEEKGNETTDHAHDANLKVNSEGTILIDQEVPDTGTRCLESSKENIHSESESVMVLTESEITLNVELNNLESKQLSDVKETSLEHSKNVNTDEVEGESSDTEVGKFEKLPESNEETKGESTKIENPLEEVFSNKNEDKEHKDDLGEQQVEKCEEGVTEIREVRVGEEPEEESEKINLQVMPDEEVEPLRDTNNVEESSNEVLIAEKESYKEESRIEEVVPGRKEVLENFNECIEEGKTIETVETIEKVDENAGKTSDEVILNKESNVSEPGSMLTEQESIQNYTPEEKFGVEKPVKEALKAENESLVCGEVDKDVVPEGTPSTVVNTQNTIPELTESCEIEKGDTETTNDILIPEERVQDEYILQREICSEVKAESDLPQKMDVEETNDVKSETQDISCRESAEPSKESGEFQLTEVTGKEETAKPEEMCLNDFPAMAEPKGTEKNCEEPSLVLSEELKLEGELPKIDEIKDEPVGETADKNDDGEIAKEEDEAKTEPGKGRKRRRSRKQSGEVMPARATRSAKKSVDEDINIFQELPIKKETRKRKSQDSDNADVGKVPESGPGEETSAVEAEEKKVETRRNSTANAVSDESSTVAQEQVSEVGGKRKKTRNKKKVDSRVRKSTEEEHESSEDENKVAEEGEAAANEEEKKKKGAKSRAKDGTPRTRQLIPERELKLLGISNMEELPTVRQSRRIAQLKLKEEAERKKLEEAAREEAKKEKKRKKKKKKLSKTSVKKRKTAAATGEESYEEEGGGGDEEDDADIKQKDKKRKKKKRDKLVFNELNPWISSSGSSSADEDDEEIEDEAHEEEEILFKSDHEFSPESDIEDPDYKPIKRARTAKVDPKDATEADSKYDDTACEKCGEKDHPEWILLCDKCDKGWHASCVRPALMVVPEGDWFCPPCEHTSLIQKLRESLVEYDRCQKQRENEELRRKRLAFVGISLDNVLPSKKEKKPKLVVDNEGESEETASENGGEDSSSSGSSSSDASSSGESSEPVYQLRERRSNVTSYRYNEYDELIKSALQEEMEAAKGVGLGKGKDIGNQAEGYEEGVEEAVDESAAEGRNDLANVNVEAETKAINPQIPKDILEAKPRLKSKKDGDEDYVVESEAEEDEDYNEEENGEAEEEELGDEVPPVVPRYDKKKKKTRSLNVRGLEFTSDEEEEDNSDSDFKGESTEEESDYSLPSESESSDGIRKKQKSFDGPLRRSTRARTSRYDKEFINDDSEDEAPRKKKSRNVWIDSESSDSDRSWGKRKKRNTRGGNRSTIPKKKTKTKTKKKKIRKKSGDSDYEDEEKAKKSRNRKVKYGGLDELDEEQVLVRRTRGKKINYQEMNASDSDDEVLKRRPRVIGDSDEEFVAEKEKSGDSEAEDEGGVTKSEANGKAVSKKSILRKIKKKRPKVIPDPNDFSEEDLLEDEELDVFAEELEDLDEEEEDMLQEMLNDGDVPIRELKEALEKLKERRKEKNDDVKPYPPIPEHMENPGPTPRFPRIGKMKVTPSRSELPSQLGLPAESVIPGIRTNPGVLLGNLSKDGDRHESVRNEQQGNIMLINEPKTESKEGLMNMQPPPYPFPAEGPGLPSLVNAHAFPLNNRPPAPPYNSFQGIIPPHTRLPPEYPHPNIPTTVLGIENDSLQEIRKQGQKPANNNKRKNEDSLSPPADSGEENSGDGRVGDNVDSPKRRGRGRGKKQLLAEAQAKQEIAISTVQAPTQFPPRGSGPEGAAAGSVITRMLNTPQGPQPFPPDFTRGRSFRPPFPNALRPPLNPPSPSPLRTPSSLAAPPSMPLFHVTLPLDIPASSIGLPQGKPSQLPPGFPSRPPVLPRYPSDPNIRPPFPSHSSSPRSESFPFPNFYPGPFPPPIPNNEESPFHNPNFPNHPFDEHSLPGSGGSVKPPYEEEAGGEFGGLASYFASQREDDLDT